MTFDYILRPGVSPTTNALKLLKFVGLATDTRSIRRTKHYSIGAPNVCGSA